MEVREARGPLDQVPGETDLNVLLAAMRPVLHEAPYVFCSISREVYEALPFAPLGMFREAEGISIVVEERAASAHGLLFDSTWACITLTVHSSLAAVGFLATIAARLARAGIGVNPISAYHHDHLFVPWTERWRVMDILNELGRGSR